jgi:hypothetical protein
MALFGLFAVLLTAAAKLIVRLQSVWDSGPCLPPTEPLSVTAWRLNGREVHHRCGRRFVVARVKG